MGYFSAGDWVVKEGHDDREDSDGKFDWAAPDEEVHKFMDDLERAAGTYLYGRRMYETMVGWETDPGFAAESPVMRGFAGIWPAAEVSLERSWYR